MRLWRRQKGRRRPRPRVQVLLLRQVSPHRLRVPRSPVLCPRRARPAVAIQVPPHPLRFRPPIKVCPTRSNGASNLRRPVQVPHPRLYLCRLHLPPRPVRSVLPAQVVRGVRVVPQAVSPRRPLRRRLRHRAVPQAQVR